MSRKFLTPLDLGKNELQNAVVQNLGSAPSAPVKGQLYFDSTGNVLYWWDGTTWQAAKSSGGAFPGYGSVPAETTFGIAKNDGVASTVPRSDHTHGTPTHLAADHATIPLNSFAAPTGAVNMGGQLVSNVATPASASDGANKSYVDNLQAGLSWKESVRAATTVNGALATAFANGQVIDGVTLATGNRILLKNQTTGAENGIYTVNASGAPTRATDADAVGELEQATVFVQEGTSLKDTAWVCTTDGPITPGSTVTTWVQFGAGTAAVAGQGLVATGQVWDIGTDGSITLFADAIGVAYAGTGSGWGSASTAAHSDHLHTLSAQNAYMQMTSVPVGAGTSTVITHNLGTVNVLVQVFRTVAPFDTVECDVERTTVNTVTVRFATAVAANDYTVLVAGYHA